MVDDHKPEPPLTLVADNSSVKIEQRRARQEAEHAETRARDAIRRLTINLLRIIAGAGEPVALLRDIDTARTTYIQYITAAERAGCRATLLTDELTLDHLFSSEDRERQPMTEEDWDRWAAPIDPYDEYCESKTQAKIELRRAALRQVASALSTGESRDPSLKAHGGNLDDVIEVILSAKTRFQQRRSQSSKADPARQAIAEQKKAELRQQRRVRQIASLPPHQVAGLRAVNTGMVDQTDSFTLDVLGRMKLLARPKNNKKKSAWQLTDDGRLALTIHNQHKS
jgi:hypothetical protein